MCVTLLKGKAKVLYYIIVLMVTLVVGVAGVGWTRWLLVEVVKVNNIFFLELKFGFHLVLYDIWCFV